jgi:hypothetical protein
MSRKSPDMQIFIHHIYEYQKGLRSLVLHTMNISEQARAEQMLEQRKISYQLQIVNTRKINIFFGAEECVNIIKSFGNKSLSDYSDEEDFILGSLLGYDKLMQCERYLKRKNNTN